MARRRSVDAGLQRNGSGDDQPAGYALFDHTADIGLRAWGPTPNAAFAEAARGMFAVMLGEDWASPEVDRLPEVRDISVSGADWVDLLVNWLAELLFLFETEDFVLVHAVVEQCEPTTCRARLSGYLLGEDRPTGGLMIKAVTYHQTSVDVTPESTLVQVIFDV